MTAFAARFAGCLGAFGICALVFPGSCTLWGVLWGGLALALLYLLVRPLVQTVILPLNLLLLGVFTPLTDGLLVLWACAWTPGTELGYWQAVAAALLCSLFWLPYVGARRRKLQGFSR